MRGAIILTIGLALLGTACGLKPELPDQNRFTGGLSDESYTLPYYWVIDGVDDMIVHRNTRIFSVIQHADSVSIYPTYAREDTLPAHKRLFTGLVSPRYLADGNDYKFRLWIYDAGDETLKGYDGGEFLDALSVEIQHSDPLWLEPIAIAADDEGRVFVAERSSNRVLRYQVGDPGDASLEAAGELHWVSQATGAQVRDIAYSLGQIVLLDDGLLTLQLLDPAGQATAQVGYFDGILVEPLQVTASPSSGKLFVLDAAGPVIWEIDRSLAPESALRVNEGTNQVLSDVSAFTVNENRVYVADRDRGRIFDYEKRQ